MHIVILVLLGIGLWVWYARSRELFLIVVRNGKQTVVRGYAPTGLLNNFGDALQNISQGEIRAHRTVNGARLSFGGGIDPGTAQRLRNIFGLYPMSQLAAAPLDKRKAANSAFTISALLSMLRRFLR
ncbi:MAG: DUF3634 family protein [Myxococcales bacterium]|nr:DUF3634 family protein [Myxococcales bacterium]